MEVREEFELLVFDIFGDMILCLEYPVLAVWIQSCFEPHRSTRQSRVSLWQGHFLHGSWGLTVRQVIDICPMRGELKKALWGVSISHLKTRAASPCHPWDGMSWPRSCAMPIRDFRGGTCMEGLLATHQGSIHLHILQVYMNPLTIGESRMTREQVGGESKTQPNKSIPDGKTIYATTQKYGCLFMCPMTLENFEEYSCRNKG